MEIHLYTLTITSLGIVNSTFVFFHLLLGGASFLQPLLDALVLHLACGVTLTFILSY